jgi:hypothetical protein
MFFMVPVFALLLKLLYWRSDHFYVHHLVFGLHFHSFTFLTLLVILLIYLVSDKAIGTSLALAPPVYLFFGLKRVYGQSLWITLSKLLVMLASYLVVVSISLFVVAIVALFLLK